MARHNQVILWGQALSDATVRMDEVLRQPSMASLFLSVVSQDRDNGIKEANAYYFEPFIFTEDASMAAKMMDIKKGDLVELHGVVTTLDAKRGQRCPHCGEVTTHDGEITFVTPTFVEVRYTGLSEDEADRILKEHREISNRVTLVGYLCGDVTMEKKAKIYGDLLSASAHKGLAKYQIAVNRKLFIASDNPNTKTDYPHIISIGEHAEEDFLSIYKGSKVLVDGMIATRKIRKVGCVCAHCNEKYDWEERVTEVVSYGTEYLSDFKTIEGTIEEEKERRRKEREEAAIRAITGE